jgi:hypothetical protein
MSDKTQSEKPTIETVLVCYTQASFDELEKPGNSPEQEPAEELARARYLARLATQLTTALQAAGCTTEIVRVPQTSFAPRDISKAAFAWRILDLKESNGRPIDLALCLDFPAWSLQHPRKWVWLTSLPNFIMRSRITRPTVTTAPPDLPKTDSPQIVLNDLQAEQAQAVASLLQAERRGLAEAYRLLAGSRPVAEELARRGLQVDFNPLPPDLASDPSGPDWQTAIKRLLGVKS